jgi:hypothetical protein
MKHRDRIFVVACTIAMPIVGLVERVFIHPPVGHPWRYELWWEWHRTWNDQFGYLNWLLPAILGCLLGSFLAFVGTFVGRHIFGNASPAAG